MRQSQSKNTFSEGEKMKGAYKYIKPFFLWVLLSLVLGLATGLVGALFHKTIAYATLLREEHEFLIYFLPLSGIVITALYSLSHEKLTTNAVIASIREGKAVSPLMVPFIFIGTALTHLTGGSAGREGAALQIGGAMGASFGKIIKASPEMTGVLTVAGMAGAFSAIFTTPVTAAVFAIEVVTVGHMRYFQLMPAMISSVTGYLVTRLLGNERLYYGSVAFPEAELKPLLYVFFIAIIISLMSSLFCVTLHKTEKFMARKIENAYLRAALGGAAVVLLTMLLGTKMFNGAGMDTIGVMLSGDKTKVAAVLSGFFALSFLIKTVMTALTIGSGFKGGEIVPAFFVGTTLGALLGLLFGVDPSFAAAVGMVGMFSGITNCPMASIILGCELFGADGMIYYTLSVAVAFIMSGRFGLYESQRLVYKKYGVGKEE